MAADSVDRKREFSANSTDGSPLYVLIIILRVDVARMCDGIASFFIVPTRRRSRSVTVVAQDTLNRGSGGGAARRSLDANDQNSCCRSPRLGGRVVLHFLPPYCPDHHLIERVWRDLHANETNVKSDDTPSLRNHSLTIAEWYLAGQYHVENG